MIHVPPPHNLIIRLDGQTHYLQVENPRKAADDAVNLFLEGGILQVIDINRGLTMVLGPEALGRATITALPGEYRKSWIEKSWIDPLKEQNRLTDFAVKREGSIDVDSLRGEINAMIANGKSNAKIGIRLIQIGEDLLQVGRWPGNLGRGS